MDQLMFDRQFHTNTGLEYLQDLVRPHLHMFKGKDFLQWSRDQGFSISSTNHPLEQAHRAAADYLIPRALESLGQINKYP
jgi:hypothetical protein